MLATILLASATVTLVQPISGDGPRHANVRTHDLDLGSPAGLALLEQRLQAAVRLVCPVPVTLDLQAALDHRACKRIAARSVADARAAAIMASHRVRQLTASAE